jgi:murein DD-endopeptidase MepM/ murein hydrolase activator NlpD
MRRASKALWLILASLALGGCGIVSARTNSSKILDLSATAPNLLTRHMNTNTPIFTKSLRPPASRTPMPAPVLSPQPATDTPRIPTSTPTLPAISEICSPLEFVELKDLPWVVSDGYNPPPKRSDARHPGVDLVYYHWKGSETIEGTQVRSVLAGKVTASINNSFPYGNVIIIETPAENLTEDLKKVFGIGPDKSVYLLYAHMLDGSPFIPLGETVQPCDVIGRVGKTGNTDAAHLHLETRIGPQGVRFEVFSYYRDDDTAEEKENYRLWSISGQFIHFDPMRLLLFTFNHGATSTPEGK